MEENKGQILLYANPVNLRTRLFALWLLGLVVIPLSAHPVIHRAAADVRLASDYISMTHILEITPQDADEFRIPVKGKHLHKKCILYVDLLGRDGHFEKLNKWNPTVSAAEKQFKCGRMWKDADVAELCWGLVPAKRGTYYITYPLVNVLYSEAGHDVLDYDFILLDEQCPAERAEIKIHLKEGKITPSVIDLDHSTADGDILLRDGELFVTANSAPGGITRMHVHLAFKPGLFEGIPIRQEYDLQRADDFSTNGQTSLATGVPSPVLDEELHSDMMNDTTPETESGGVALFEYIAAYPKTSIFIACLLVVLSGLIFRFIKASRL